MHELIRPHPRVRSSYLEACGEFTAGWRTLLDLDALTDPAAFGLYCRALNAGLLEWQQTHTGPLQTWWWVDGDVYLGEAAIRPARTPETGAASAPLRLQGHIGYEIRPSARGRGHGRGLVRATLRRAYEAGVDPVVLAIAPDNAGSIRCVRACGGVPVTRPLDGVQLFLASGRDL